MSINNRLINTGGGGGGGVTGATFEAADYGFNTSMYYGMDAYDGIMYNTFPAAYSVSRGTWLNEDSIAPRVAYLGMSGMNGCAYIPEADGMLVLRRDQGKIYRFEPKTTLFKSYDAPNWARPWDVTALPNGFAYTHTDGSSVSVATYNGNIIDVVTWTPSQGTTSQAMGLAWDGTGIWVSSGNTSAGEGVAYKYDIDGNYLGYSFACTSNKPFSMLGYDPINFKFYGFHQPAFASYGSFAARYNAIF